jgi:hypothetical protein
MARIFTLEQMRANQVPMPSRHFDQAFALLREGVINQPWFLGGMSNGSYALGKHTVISDLNTLLVCRAESFVEASEYLADLRETIVNKAYVKISTALVTPREMGYLPSHIFSSGIWRHMLRLEASAKTTCFIGENPLKYLNKDSLIAPKWLDELESYRGSTSRKVHDAAKHREESGEWYDNARMVLDRPFHAARSFINWSAGSEAYWIDSPDNLTRSFYATLEHYGSYESTDLGMLYTQFQNVKIAYRHYIESVANQKEWRIDHQQEYLDQLRNIQSHLPELYRFVSLLSEVARHNQKMTDR